MRRGEVFIGEIVEYQHNGLLLFIEEIGRTVLLEAQEILGGLKAKHKTMVGVPIAVRIKSLRPFAVSNKFIDKNDSRRKMRQWELLHNSILAHLSVFTSPPETRNPRLRPIKVSKS